jgi:hypothetical protein
MVVQGSINTSMENKKYVLEIKWNNMKRLLIGCIYLL